MWSVVLALLLGVSGPALAQSDGLGGALDRQHQELTRPPTGGEAPSAAQRQPLEQRLEQERLRQRQHMQQQLQEQQPRPGVPLPPGCVRVGQSVVCR